MGQIRTQAKIGEIIQGSTSILGCKLVFGTNCKGAQKCNKKSVSTKLSIKGGKKFGPTFR